MTDTRFALRGKAVVLRGRRYEIVEAGIRDPKWTDTPDMAHERPETGVRPYAVARGGQRYRGSE